MWRKIFRENYVKFFIISVILQLVFRGVEIVSLLSRTGFHQEVFYSELFGLFSDFILINSLLLLFYPLYYLITKISCKVANMVTLSIILIFSVLHCLILRYYIYQFIPLDIFFLHYSLQEVAYTVKTSGVSIWKTAGGVVGIVFLIITSYCLLKKLYLSERKSVVLFNTLLLSLPCWIIFLISGISSTNDMMKNKSLYFYSSTFPLLFNSVPDVVRYTTEDAVAFAKLYKGRNFVSAHFPLLHNFEKKSKLTHFFSEFDTMPNVVILIVEGLSDDFIHDFKGVKMMPFLDSLTHRSLYWERCFTLGERSFAVVPSLLGGLPYGNMGFTLIEKLPRHLSLASILKSNGYYTSFFYGQGKWFHQKDRFFKYNHTDLLFDNEMFDDKYAKIVVGDDNFFWGYHDKDLFDQSLRVIDTLKEKVRLDIYFSGTMHSPFIIDHEQNYEYKLQQLIANLEKKSDIDFFNSYQKYIKAILFTDDALRDYFNGYAQQMNHENTIFIITGDHPMSEIPVNNSLKKYHVPLIIYSEKLVKPMLFSNTVNHLDIYETLLSFLDPYINHTPTHSTSLGGNLFDDHHEKYPVVFMSGNREMIDCYDNGYFLSGKQFFKVDENLNLIPENDLRKQKIVEDKLAIFTKTNSYVCSHDRIIPDTLYCSSLNFTPLYIEKQKSLTIDMKDKYLSVVPALFVPNHDIIYEISFKYTGDISDISLVCEFKTMTDSLLYWENFGIFRENNLFEGQFEFSQKEILDSLSVFSSYLWNPHHRKVEIFDLNTMIYTKKK